MAKCVAHAVASILARGILPEQMMQRNERRRFGLGSGVLLAALLVFGGSLAIAVTRKPHGAAGGAPAATADAADPLAALERSARAQPGDGGTWAALGQHYFDAGRYGDAVAAYDHATRLDARKAAWWSALGEARVMASPHDPMPAPAVIAFDRALALDGKDPRGRYFKAVQLDLAGKHQGALDKWLALLGDTPPGAPWEGDLRRTIEQVGKINHVDVADRLAAIRQPAALPGAQMVADAAANPAAAGISGPTTEQLQAASSIPPSQQDAMAQTMVARLEARLRDQPRNLDGWLMLMRSRMMLNQPEKATAALAAALAANPAAAGQLREQASVLGIK